MIFAPGFTAPPTGGSTPTVYPVTLADGQTNVDLYLAFQAAYPGATLNAGDTVNFTLNAGSTIGSVSTGFPPTPAVTITLTNNGNIYGGGGDGGDGIDFGIPDPGEDGGTAFSVTNAITIDNTSGVIAGGGGGGGGSDEDGSGNYCGGGGGAGFSSGSGGTGDGSDPAHDGDSGTLTAGGSGGNAGTGASAGDGGNRGQAGQASTAAGGAAGAAVTGGSNVTWVAQGTIFGAIIP